VQLHITNGDAAVSLLAAGGIAGQILPWRDVLHEGPVPALPLEALSSVRSVFLASRGWGSRDSLDASFQKRDRTLRRFRDYRELVLWFEHDLYDQLQLMQILAFLAEESLPEPSRVKLICIDRHEDVERFCGLGDLQPKHIAPLYQMRQEVSCQAFTVSRRAWQAFSSPNLMLVQRFLSTDLSVLPFMKAALFRYLQELPSTFNGLSRTANHALGAIASGCTAPIALFKAHWAEEAVPFLGDWSFWHVLRTMACAPAPLITVYGSPIVDSGIWDPGDATLEITDVGHSVLKGQRDAVALRGIDRWYGGAHLKGYRTRWRWDDNIRRVVNV